MCVDERFLGSRKPPEREQWAGGTACHGSATPVSWSKAVPFTPGAHLAQSSEPGSSREVPLPCQLLPAQAAVTGCGLSTPSSSLQAGGHRDPFPVHLVKKELSLTPRWVFYCKLFVMLFNDAPNAPASILSTALSRKSLCWNTVK